MRRSVVPDRVTPGDLVQLATDVGPVPMNVGALLALAPGADPATTADVVAVRLGRVRRLQQRLVRPAPGLGRPYWVDADAGPPVGVVPLDGRLLVDVAVDEVTRPLDLSRPPWRAVVVADGGAAVGVVVVMHHVLADGVGGLAVLRRLVDDRPQAGAVPVEPRDAPDAAPGRTARPGTVDLLRDAWTERARSARALGRTLRGLRRGRGELGRGTGLAPRCSLCAPTGPRRRAGTVTTDLDALRSTTRRHGATVNDALVVAVTGAMDAVLRARGERVAHLVVSVPVSARRTTDERALGNQVGVMPVAAPLEGSTAERLAAVAAVTRVRRSAGRGASAALVGPAFRALAAVGAFRPLVERQRLVNTFLTNLVGPAEPLRLAGARVEGVVPLTITAGNVGAAFAALSYAGRLTVVAITDPDVVPELDVLLDALGDELERVRRLP